MTAAIRRRRTPADRGCPSEKVEQMHGVITLTKLGAKVYVLGTRRGRGKRCPKCGEFVSEHQGTRQTPGIADVYALLPSPGYRPAPGSALWWECKAADGRLSPDQQRFRDACLGANVPHVVGTCNDLIAWLIRGGWLRAETLPHYRRPDSVSTLTEELPNG